jgi:hypothetical protein
LDAEIAICEKDIPEGRLMELGEVKTGSFEIQVGNNYSFDIT